MWAGHSKHSSIDIKPTHLKQSSADFRTMNIPKDAFNNGIRVEKEIDVIKYNLLSPKPMKVGETMQYATNYDYFDKRNKFITDLNKSATDKAKKVTVKGNESMTNKIPLPKRDIKLKPKRFLIFIFVKVNINKASTTKILRI